jgi:hypothetical protein
MGGEAAITEPPTDDVNITPSEHQGKEDQGKIAGAATEILLQGGKSDPAHYEVRELADVIPSHNPEKQFAKRADYPANVQERPYHSDRGEQEKVRGNALNYLPAYVISTDSTAGNGPPVITKEGVVLGGNSRAMTLQLVYTHSPEKAEAYKAMLREKAAQFGVDPAALDAMQQPILIRVVDDELTPEEMAVKSRLYNQTTTQKLQAKAEGVSRAKMISEETLGLLSADMAEFDTLRQFLDSPKSIDFVNALMRDGVLEQAEISSLTEKTGRLNDAGKTQVENALRGMIVADYDVLSSVPPSVKAAAKETIRKLADYSGAVAVYEPKLGSFFRYREGQELFQFAGERSAMSPEVRANLARAQGLAEGGTENEAIRQKTGWFRGMDGKWRYEIPDHPKGIKKFKSKNKKPQPGEYKLGDIYDNEPLYRAYPQLRDMNVHRIIGMEEGALGGYDPDSKSIEINFLLSDISKTLMHEIQHAIQNIEGFARGGSSSEFSQQNSKQSILDGVETFRRMAFESIPEELKEDARIVNRGEDADGSSMARLQANPQAKVAWADYIRALEDAREISLRPESDFDGLSPDQQYELLAGEIEARDSSARSYLTDEERAAKAPNPREDAIVLFGGERVAAMSLGDTQQPRYTPSPSGKRSEDFVTLPGGGIDFAQFPDVTLNDGRKMRAAPVRLQRGYDSMGLNGNGYEHIEKVHGDEIRKAGYGNAQEFVWDLVNNFDAVWQGEGKSILLVKNDGTSHKPVGFIELTKDGEFYRVKNAFPAGRQYPTQVTRKLLWKRATSVSSASDKQNPFTRFSAAPTSPARSEGSLQRQRGQSSYDSEDIQQPEADVNPLASLGNILNFGIRGAVKAAEADGIKVNFRSKDIGLLKSFLELPHWIAKNHPGFAKVYERQIERQDERAAAVKKSLEQAPSLFGKDRLKKEDMDSLRKILWETEGKNQKEIEDVEKFLPDGKLANGREKLKTNPEFYEAYEKWIAGLKGTEGAKKALLEIRKSLDNDLVIAHNRMAEMREMDDDAIKAFRQNIGHVPNYFPHHRYGKYYMQAKDKDGNVVFRQHVDAPTKGQALRKLRQIKREREKSFPHAAWESGENERLPDEALGAPIDTEAMEQIIRAAASKISDRNHAEEITALLLEGSADILKTRGWGSHSIKRKGIPGFETEDIARVLYDYKAGLNGWLTKMEAARDFSEALSDIDARSDPGLWKYTSQYVRDMLRNSDKIDRMTGNIKSVAFAWYLGGSIKTAAVNATQNIVVGVPRLQMDVTGGGLAWIRGARAAIINRLTGNKGAGLTEDEARLVNELHGKNIITAAYMEEVRGQLSGISGAGVWNKFVKVLGIPMSGVERFNRASLALAAYRAARDGRMKPRAAEKYGVKGGKATYEQAKAFASAVVRDAHFVYGKSNMPEFMRGTAAGRSVSSMYTFRTFSHNMINMWKWALSTQGREGALFTAKSLGATIALGGLTAFPFYATAMAIFQAVTGDDDDWTAKIRSWLPENNLLRDVACYGFPAIAGVNLGGSLGMETPLKRGLQTGATPKEVIVESIGDILGIPYDLFVEKPSKMMEFSRHGETYRMVEEAAPTVVKNAMQAYRLATRGQTTKSGRPINDPGKPGARTLTETEAAGKLLGFQPVSATKSYEAYRAQRHSDDVRSDKINDLTALALETYDTGKPEGRARMMRELRSWNDRMKAEGKPAMIIKINDIQRRIRARRRENRPTPKQKQKGVYYGQAWGL